MEIDSLMMEVKLKDIQRFFKHIKVVGSCWEWQGATLRGYGRFRMSTNLLAHRFSYSLFVGELDPKLTIDHLCRNHSCVNPNHLEEVSIKENLQRSPICLATINSKKTHCHKGHSLSGDNLYIYKNYRMCKSCKNENSRIYNLTQKGLKQLQVI